MQFLRKHLWGTMLPREIGLDIIYVHGQGNLDTLSSGLVCHHQLQVCIHHTVALVCRILYIQQLRSHLVQRGIHPKVHSVGVLAHCIYGLTGNDKRHIQQGHLLDKRAGSHESLAERELADTNSEGLWERPTF